MHAYMQPTRHTRTVHCWKRETLWGVTTSVMRSLVNQQTIACQLHTCNHKVVGSREPVSGKTTVVC